MKICLTVCRTFYDGFVDTYYRTLSITIYGRPPCAGDPSLALAINPPNLIANMRGSDAMAKCVALAHCVSVYLDPHWDGVTTVTSPSLDDLVWLFRHLHPVELHFSSTAEAHFLQSALLEVLNPDRLRSLSINVSEDGETEAFQLGPFKSVINGAAGSLVSLTLPTEEHRVPAWKEKHETVDMPAEFPNLVNAEVVCDELDAVYAGNVLARASKLAQLVLHFRNSTSVLDTVWHLISVADGEIKSLDLQSRAGYPYGNGTTAEGPPAILDLTDHDHILYMSVLSVNGPAFHLFPPKLRTLAIDRVHLSLEEQEDEGAGRDALDGGRQTALQQLRELLARPDWQPDLGEIRLGSSDKLYGRRLYIPADLQAIMRTACERRGITLTLLNCDEKSASGGSGSDPSAGGSNPAPGSDPSGGSDAPGDSDPGGATTADDSPDPGMVSHSFPQSPAAQAQASLDS